MRLEISTLLPDSKSTVESNLQPLGLHVFKELAVAAPGVPFHRLSKSSFSADLDYASVFSTNGRTKLVDHHHGYLIVYLLIDLYIY